MMGVNLNTNQQETIEYKEHNINAILCTSGETTLVGTTYHDGEYSVFYQNGDMAEPCYMTQDEAKMLALALMEAAK